MSRFQVPPGQPQALRVKRERTASGRKRYPHTTRPASVLVLSRQLVGTSSHRVLSAFASATPFALRVGGYRLRLEEGPKKKKKENKTKNTAFSIPSSKLHYWKSL